MTDTPTARRRQILELLDTRRMLTIQELVAELGVSAMTVHRDLDRLAAAGYLAKTRGGATLRCPDAHDSGGGDLCAMCNRTVPARTAVIIQSARRGRLCACCPHCGLALTRSGSADRPDAGDRFSVLPDDQRERGGLSGRQRGLVMLQSGDPGFCLPPGCGPVPARIRWGGHGSHAGAASTAAQDVHAGAA